jgi:hypothetical protein
VDSEILKNLEITFLKRARRIGRIFI